jgi:hypothetical protein
MASAMRPMPLDGACAAAQVWKLDTYKGRTIPLSTMLAEFLMMPAFPSARIQAWIEQYGRIVMPVVSRVQIRILPHEEFPQDIDDAVVVCSGLRIVDGERRWIDYHGTAAQYLSQREAIFGTSAPANMLISVRLTDDERHYLSDWDDRYVCPWPLVDGEWRPGYHTRAEAGRRMQAHPQLRELYERYREFSRRLAAESEMEPIMDEFDYVALRYGDGELISGFTMIRDENRPESDDSSDDWD